MRARWFAAMALVAGCKKAPASSGSEPEPRKADPVVVAKPAAVDAGVVVAVDATPVDCSEVGKLTGELQRAFAAMEPFGIYERARDGMPRVPAACRDATFYVDVAILLEPPRPSALAIDGVSFASRGQALAEAAKAPLDLFALRWLAFYGAIDHEVALPAGACAFADTQSDAERAAYVCGHEALSAGDGAEAARRFDAMTEAFAYADVPLRRAQAALLTGDRKTAAKLAKQAMALDSEGAARGRAYEYDRQAIVAEAKRVLEEANRKVKP